MEIASHLVRWGGARMSRRMSKSLPWIGAGIALLTLAGTMKRKGVVRGGVDTALNALPFVGAMKNIAEAVRGRDFIADRPARAAAATSLRRSGADRPTPTAPRSSPAQP
jgi:hypothetical protein